MENMIKNINEVEETKLDDPIDKCVICGKETPYRFSTPIIQREFYVEGAGQVCRHCYALFM